MKKGKSQKRPLWQRFLIFMVTCLLIIAVCGSLVLWQWQNITAYITNVTVGILQLFGWGLVLVVLAIMTLVIVILANPMLLIRYWNRWIGLLVLLGAIWGILAFFPGYGYLAPEQLGGKIGTSIIGQPGVIGALIVLLLIIIGLFFLAPRVFSRCVVGLFAWVFGRFRKEPAAPVETPQNPSSTPISPKLTVHRANEETELKKTAFPRYTAPPQPKAALPINGSKSWLWNRLHPQDEAPGESSVEILPLSGESVPEATAPLTEAVARETSKAEDDNSLVTSAEVEKAAAPFSETNETPEKKEETPSEVRAGPSKEVKQVAQEVWKKYGETGAQVTADGWKLPPIEILDNTPEVEFSQADNIKKAKLIEDALASYGVEGKVVQINVGPTVTQFGIEPGWDRKLKEVKEKDKNGDVQVKIEEVAKTRVKVDRITSLANDLSLALAAPSIRIEAPVPGKSVVGVEVPNTIIGTVSLRSVVESNIFQKMEAKARLTVALGKGAGGESVVADLTKMPHLLIAGATGSGKTVCIHSTICCLLLYNTPNDVRFIMIDPKRVELTSYNSLPHLATPVIVETNRALLALRGLAQEMDKRYQTLAAVRFRNIEAYNKARPNEKLPYLVLVIDELADLMMTAGEEVERTICRLAQLARAVGIHLIVATQRPSVDVVTGLIKANFPTRISFAVTSQVDSRTILDSAGAEKLLGRGDMLYMPTEAAKPKRLQGCFLSDPEIERVVYFWNNQRKETANQLKMDDLVAEEEAREEKTPADPLLLEARKLLEQHEHISASFLQRHLRIGYPRAARLMEQLEAEMGEGIAEEVDVKDAEEDDK
jgi:DNA segregation ATPase FtsK/SpoIIIE, S-DNA-T family